jgi:hypothetical protein
LNVYDSHPLHFEPNRGQADAAVRFLARGPDWGLFLSEQEAVLTLSRGSPNDRRRPGAGFLRAARRERLTTEVLRMGFEGGRLHLEGEAPLPGTSSYFLGSDRSRWMAGIPNYRRLRARNVWPGIDLVFYGGSKGLEYDFVLRPGAKPGAIRLRYRGARSVAIDRIGNLGIRMHAGRVVHRRPVVYQEIDGVRRKVAGRFVMLNREVVGFRLGSFDHRRELVIDPTLSYSTYLGSAGHDWANSLAMDGEGNVLITGITSSTNFPRQAPYQDSNAGEADIFVTKLDPVGNVLIYSTYLGGGNEDNGLDIATDADGNAYVTGATFSTNFPTQNAYQVSYGGGDSDAFLSKLNSSGTALVYSTYLGGSNYEFATSVAVDGGRKPSVAGFTTSVNFPTHNPVQVAAGGGGDAFVTKLESTGTAPVYSTYVGGSGGDAAQAIVSDSAGNVYITGNTASTNFPTRNALQATSGGGANAFVTKLDTLGGFAYSTYLGGGGGAEGLGIAVDGEGRAHVTGQTLGGFPTKFPYQTFRGAIDGFITKLTSGGDELVYSTYLGGTGADVPHGIALDSLGHAYVVGNTNSGNFPTRNPIQTANAGGQADVFVTKLSGTGTALIFSSYLGGSGADRGYGIAVGPADDVWIAGQTDSTDFPTQAPIQTDNAGGTSDIFISRILVPPMPAAFYTLDPCRVADTRAGLPLTGNSTRAFQVAGLCDIPLDAISVAFNVTAVEATNVGNLRLYPTGQGLPLISTINFRQVPARSNNAIISVGTGGQVTVWCDITPGQGGSTHLVLDAYGYFK